MIHFSKYNNAKYINKYILKSVIEKEKQSDTLDCVMLKQKCQRAETSGFSKHEVYLFIYYLLFFGG